MTRPASTIANLLMSTNHTYFPPIDRVEDRYDANPYQFWEFVIATYFAEGVARVGYSQQLESAVHFVNGSNPGTDQCIIFIPPAWHSLDIYPEDRPKGINLTSFFLQGKVTGGEFAQFNTLYLLRITRSQSTDLFLSITTQSMDIMLQQRRILFLLAYSPYTFALPPRISCTTLFDGAAPERGRSSRTSSH